MNLLTYSVDIPLNVILEFAKMFNSLVIDV